MARKILFIDLFTHYGYGTTLVQKIAASFETVGYIPVILDVDSPDAAQTLQQCIHNKKDFLFSFSTGSGITEASKIGGKYIHQWLEIPHYASFADHPLYKHAFIDFRLKDVLYGFTDEAQVDFCKAFFEGRNYAFFPHFSLIEVDEPINENEFAKKETSVFFSGGATIMERTWSANISSPLQSKAVCTLKETGVDVEGLIDHFLCKEDDYPPLDIALINQLRSHPALSEMNDHLIAKMFIEIDIVIRSIKRRRALEALHGMELVIAGNGWDQCDYLDRQSTLLLGEQKYLDCERSRRNYQISLNTPHGQPRGLHDRILHASCQGQVVITNGNEFVRKNFNSGNLVFYSMEENNIRNRVEEVLNDNQLRYKMACAGQDYMKKGLHSSDHAANRVLQQLKEHELI